MPSCCHADEYATLFGGREARWRSWIFERFGLRGSKATAAAFAAEAGGPDATVLEVGGGLGELQVTLLEGGAAASATCLELSPGWEQAAGRLLARRGLADRVERRIGDVVDDVDELAPADVVVAHRVLCCYPHWRRMADALAALTRRRLVITLPVDRRRTRAFVRSGNWVLRRGGREFQAFVHPVDAILDHLAEKGLRVVADDAGLAWRTIGLEPQAPAVSPAAA